MILKSDGLSALRIIGVSLFLIFLLCGCAAIGAIKFNNLYGPSEPKDRVIPVVGKGQIDYWNDVKPVFESRCVVCHACYDAPCQLKLGSIEGIERGASKSKVYEASRFIEASPTRLFEDAQTLAEWRDMGFHSVLNERDQTEEANRAASLIYQMLKLKEAHPLPDATSLSDEFTLSLDRKQHCAKSEEFEYFAEEHPLWGMPYALPELSNSEKSVIISWLEQGAKYSPRSNLDHAYINKIAEWEYFLNGDSIKQKLASRYLYEHLFLAHFYFKDLEKGSDTKYFKLVRSRTPPGQEVDIIASRRPYDDPKVENVYYRLVEEKEAIVAKTHMPYALSARRMAFWKKIFIDKEYVVKTLPDYNEETSANPFVVFADIPVTTRYSFLLDEAQFTVMGFIKGPVCRGQVALNVINDHFWVFFTKPDPLLDGEVSDFYAEYSDLLALPSAEKSTLRPLTYWRYYSEKQQEYFAKRDHLITGILGKKIDYNLDVIWDGNGNNDNASLTVFRHFDSATVEKGLLGPPPKTAWIISYAQLERIHYLLVAGYDVYGNVGHQLLSRLYMDFLRMEGELNFLLLLPKEAREKELRNWYRLADSELLDYLHSPELEEATEPSIVYTSDNKKLELYQKLRAKMANVLPENRNVISMSDNYVGNLLDKINEMSGEQNRLFPEHSVLLLKTKHRNYLFTILRNSAHLNITSMFGEDGLRAPNEDGMLILQGVVGAYPNAFYEVDISDLSTFVDQLIAVKAKAHYVSLRDRYGIQRTNREFWDTGDQVHKAYSKLEPINFGLLDYNRLENQ